MNNSKGSAKLIKTINRDLVIKNIIKFNEISRSELAKQTGLALPSVMRIVEPLVDKGLIIESRQAESTGGRKPFMLKINGQYKYIVGIEIAMTSSVVLSDFNGRVIDIWTGKNLSFNSPEEMLDEILKTINHWFDSYNISLTQIAGIGVGTPGFSYKHKKEIEGSILMGWESINVAKWFKERIELPIFTDNVCRTRTLSEVWFGLGRSYKDFLYVYIDQGVGSADVKNGLISKGHKLVAGEFGHTTIDYRGRPCYCGKNGCIEMYISAGSIIKDVNKQAKLSKESCQSLEEIKEYIDNDDVMSSLTNTLEVIQHGIANLINLYNPEIVILGGAVPKSLYFMMDGIEETLKPLIFNDFALETKVFISQVDNESNKLGSIALVIQEHIKAFDR